MTLVLREADVRPLLDMAEVMEWVEDSLRAYGLGRARNAPRQRIRFPQGWLHVLPAGDQDESVLGVKSYTSFRDGNRFLILLYDAADGQLLALIEADALGIMRTGAMSGIATHYLALEDADIHAVFGTGNQARGQMEAVATVRRLNQVRVYSRNASHREAFVKEMADRTNVEVVACASPKDALEGASIVSTATISRTPVFDHADVRPGTHINAIGSNSLVRSELDQRLIRKADVLVVDSRTQAERESGDLLLPVELGHLQWDQLSELSDLVLGRIPGRTTETDLTIFESHGLGLQDISVAAHIYRKALEAGLGEQIRLFEN